MIVSLRPVWRVNLLLKQEFRFNGIWREQELFILKNPSLITFIRLHDSVKNQTNEFILSSTLKCLSIIELFI